MLKTLLTLIIFLLSPLFAYAIEEIQLEKNDKSLLDNLSDIYYGNVENKDEISPALRIFSKDGLEFKKSPVKSVKLSFLFADNLTYNNTKHASPYTQNTMGIVEPMITIKFKDNKTKFMFDYDLTRKIEGYHNGFTRKISQLYISHDITPNQTIYVGQGGRLPINYDGSVPTMQREMVLKSQIGRTFGECMSVGIRDVGKYKYIDYDIGFYDSTRYMKEFGKGVDFTSFAIVKPFAGMESESVKNIKFGGGYAIGKNNVNYKTYSVYAGYDFKKFHARAEYTNADGYNGTYTSQNKADGFYTLVSYDIAPKFEILARYDYFTPNTHKRSIHSQEYSAGITYKMFKNLKFLLNYVYRHNSNSADSQMILFATKFII